MHAVKRFAFAVLATFACLLGLFVLGGTVLLGYAVFHTPSELIQVAASFVLGATIYLWFRYEYYLVDRILEVATVFFGVKEEE